MAIAAETLGRCVGFYATVDGELNTVVHLWAYESQADREQRRLNMSGDPEFVEFQKTLAARETVVKMEKPDCAHFVQPR